MFGYPLSPPFEILARKMIKGFSPMVVIVGDETGIGKSMLASRTAEIVYYRAYGLKWKPKDNLFFKISEFKKELFKSKHRIFIIEEAEVELASDDWHSIQNKYFSRMKSTQRIKGNLYILVLPIFLQLAKKHRRAVNFLFDVKGRGFFMAYKVVKRSAQVVGEDLSRFWLGGYCYNLPNCKKEYDYLDIVNKQRIEKEEGEKLDRELLIKKSQMDRIRYEYNCPYCNFVWRTSKTPDLEKNCRNPICKKRIFWREKDFKVLRILT